MNVMNMSQLMELGEKHEKEMAKKVFCRDGYITISVKEGYNYEIALDRVDSHEKIIAWVMHLSEKNWMTVPMLARFVEISCAKHGLSCRLPV